MTGDTTQFITLEARSGAKVTFGDNTTRKVVGSDSDFACCRVDRKITSGSCQFIGNSLVSWSSRKQNSVALSTTEAEYIALGSCVAQVSNNSTGKVEIMVVANAEIENMGLLEPTAQELNLSNVEKEEEEKVLVLENLYQEHPSDTNLVNLDNAKLNLFKLLVDNLGVVYDTDDSIALSSVEYFKGIFNMNNTATPIPNSNVIPMLVNDYDNFFLTQLPMEEEIWNTIHDMNGDSIINNVRNKVLQLIAVNLLSYKNFSNCNRLASYFGIDNNSFNVIKFDRIVKWVKPAPPPYVKLKTDGSVGNVSAGMGGIIGNSVGDPIALFAGPLSTVFVLTAELLGNTCADWLANFGSRNDCYHDLPLFNLPSPLKGMITGMLRKPVLNGIILLFPFWMLSTHSPALWSNSERLGHVDFVVASSSSTAREVLKTHDHVLASRPTLLAVEKIGYNSSGIGFSPYGPYWRQLRKICTQELLSTKKVKSLSFIRYEEAKNLLYNIKKISGSPVNLTEMFQEVSNILITRTAIGKECKSRQRFILAMKETIKLLPMLRVADLFPPLCSFISFFDGSSFQIKRLHREMDHVLDEIIMEHKEKEVVTHEMEEDLVDVLLRIQEKGDLQVPLTMDNVKAVILDMLVAATETTSNTMCWIMSELISHPEVMCKAQKEIREALGAKIKIEDNDVHELHYLHNVIKETLRLHPPLPLLLPRTCNEPTELCGFVIPKKARVVVNAWAIARDPKIWENPDNFYPERFDESSHDFRGTKYEYLPFGSGRRICPGTTFAMAEIELFISLLLLHFDWEIPGSKGPMELDMEEEFDGTARRKKDLYLIATTHSIVSSINITFDTLFSTQKICSSYIQIMQSLLFSSSILLLFLIQSFILFFLKRYRKKNPFHIIIQNTKLPPRPWKLPLLGSIHQLITREQTHQRFYRLAQKYGPLFHIKLGHLDFVVASSSSTAHEVLKTHDHVLASRPTLLAVEKIGYNSSGIGFSPTKKVKSLSFIRYEEAKNLLYKIKKISGSPVNLTEMFQEVNNMLITRTAIGKECKSRQRFILAMKETIKLLPMLRVADLFPPLCSFISFFDGSSFQIKRLHREMDHVLDEIIMEHKEKEVVAHEMEEDLDDVLLRIQEKGQLQVPLTMDNVKAVILDILVAATETTSNTMCWIMSELISHPEVMCKAQKEIREALGAKIKIEDNDIHELHYLHNVIKETLRLHPPLPLLLPRTCSKPTELCGFVIPKKARVVVNAWAIARDPKIWENPDNFYPERFDESAHDFRGTKYEYLPFGSGRRICPGTTFAMAEIELFISLLLLHFDWEIPGGKSPMELNMEEEFDGTARRKKDLYIIATTHSIRALKRCRIRHTIYHILSTSIYKYKFGSVDFPAVVAKIATIPANGMNGEKSTRRLNIDEVSICCMYLLAQWPIAENPRERVLYSRDYHDLRPRPPEEL
ncbi:hypothetical protein KFK09_000562 [Dendrobium nobile]|uniref:Cytochrome P450 n=1 Tax=Dendrobium nobile TaxID=94219 RepID=A0A8T3CF50_DENNO|nr:hypothetical protein KFK09_000562 [Dendrobium nobile]